MIRIIDLETLIFSEVSRKVRDHCPKAFVTGEYVPSPPSFPCVSLVEVDNATFRNSQTQGSSENHAAVTYELNVYSNKTTGKKAQCREIAVLVNDVLMGLNFTRIMLEPVPNQNDATIYRMIGRYRAVVSKENQIFRR
ncbi:hypothetical protein FACS1894217_13270 [Clostridia bacterium]|nr:hypothetical protein FACS1894217_13270 [Clostridia bacterium]